MYVSVAKMQFKENLRFAEGNGLGERALQAFTECLDEQSVFSEL